jgi:hypothetical protein
LEELAARVTRGLFVEPLVDFGARNDAIPCLTSAGNSRAEFGFGMDAATMEVILRVNAGFVE